MEFPVDSPPAPRTMDALFNALKFTLERFVEY